MSQQIEGFGSRAVKQRAMNILEKHGLLEERRWTMLFTLAAVILAILIIGSYAFNWTWTGFRGNTLWDWFQMLLEPLIIALAPIWFSTHHKWRAQWTVLVLIVVLALLVTIVGGYTLNWTWTGFKDHGTLWDWLNLFLLPLTTTALTIWVTPSPDHTSAAQS